MQVPTLTDQDRFWAGDPADWRFVSARGIAEAFYTTTEAGKAMMEVRRLPGRAPGRANRVGPGRVSSPSKCGGRHSWDGKMRSHCTLDYHS